jgi:thiol-disulfide isomerase/thioredoxin
MLPKISAMKAIHYLLLLAIGFLELSCQKTPIDYNAAIDSCKPDTMQMFRTNDTIKMPYLKEDCILGAQLSEFEGTTMDGKKIDKAYLIGKISVINFWFIGCHPCEEEMPILNKLVEKYKSDPVNFLAISRNSPKDVSEFLVEHPFNFEQIAYGQPIIEGNFRSTWGYPITIVADQNLKIIDTERGLEEKTMNEKFIPFIDRALKRI